MNDGVSDIVCQGIANSSLYGCSPKTLSALNSLVEVKQINTPVYAQHFTLERLMLGEYYCAGKRSPFCSTISPHDSARRIDLHCQFACLIPNL